MATIIGTNGRDILRGTSSPDTLRGLGGNDDLFGSGGNDFLYGGNGNDRMWGDAGNDMLFGQVGNDSLWGGAGNDTLNGGAGDDELLGGGGNDLLLPGTGGSDAMLGGAGKDTVSYANITGGVGVYVNLLMPTEEGDDGSLNDTYASVENVIGSPYGDTLFVGLSRFAYGGGGSDTLFAAGSTLRGDAGTDNLLGGGLGYADRFWLQLNQGSDVLTDFNPGQDKLLVSSVEFGIGALLNGNEFTSHPADNNAEGPTPQFIFVSNLEFLYFDTDGNGPAAPILIADIGIGVLNVSDFLVF